jgi:hypothetical protein
LRFVEPKTAHDFGWRFVEMLAAPAAERTLTHTDARCDLRDGKWLIEVLENEACDVTKFRGLLFLPPKG